MGDHVNAFTGIAGVIGLLLIAGDFIGVLQPRLFAP